MNLKSEISNLKSAEPQAPRERDLRRALALANVLEEFLRLTRDECMSLTGAARVLRRPTSLFSGQNCALARFLRGGVAALVPDRRPPANNLSALCQQIESLGWFIPAARFFYLNTNLNCRRGSVPEAVRRAMDLPNLPAGWRPAMRERFTKALTAWTASNNRRSRREETLTFGHAHENSGCQSLVTSTPTIKEVTNTPNEPLQAQSNPASIPQSQISNLKSEIAILPSCPAELRSALLARQRLGKPLVPYSIARQITVSPALVRHRRNPTSTALEYFNAAGSMFFFHDPVTGERRPPRPGEVIEADDATINFPVCVPWRLGGDSCSDRYGVKVGRFQWLVSIDAARRFVTAWTYVMRPRSSYRGEDALSLMRAHCLQHGIPLQWRFEQGVWKCNLVKQAIAAMGSHLHTVWSPHQKPHIEGLFNTLWTKLSVHFPDCDVGRFRGETEEASRLLAACQRGHQDPRRHFPMLQDALKAFGEVITEKNRTPVNSSIGRWIPEEAWASRNFKSQISDFKLPDGSEREGEGEPDNLKSEISNLKSGEFPIRRLSPETEWIFAPYTREWTVAGMNVGGRIRLFEDLAVPFDFYADWLFHYKGARVRVHFDPAAPHCQATIVLLENWRGGQRGAHRAGEVLGTAQQINDIGAYARLVLGWADDPTNAGRLARQQAASAVARETRAITGTGLGVRISEFRDGISQSQSIALDSTESRLKKTSSGARPSPGAARAEALLSPSTTESQPKPRRSLRPGRPRSTENTSRLRELQQFEKTHEHLFQ